MHDAAEDAIDRPQKNRGGAGVKRRCTYYRQLGHDAASCTYMTDAAAASRQRAEEARSKTKNQPPRKRNRPTIRLPSSTPPPSKRQNTGEMPASD
eukprot:2694634-Pleurochrysis_carterae.AAC.1